ncbi:MAG: transposase [Polyangiales bacterium]
MRDAGTSAATADVDETRFGRRPPKAQAGDVEGFNLHASVVLGARDLEGRERVSELADGRIAWRLKVSGGRGETHRIMEPMEFMARLAALVPPPRFPLVHPRERAALRSQDHRHL